jgi:putative ABC transport system ATP-binding protein
VAPVTTTIPPTTTIAARAVEASKIYGKGDTEVRALDSIDVEFPQAEYTAIMGPSGSGKSTLLHCLAGLDSLTSGHVYLGDIDLSTLSDKEVTRVRRDRVGFVFQTFNLIPTLTALENITLPVSLAGHKPDQEWLDKIVDTVRLRDRLSHRPSELSGGQQQRVAVARAVVNEPNLVLADEPTGNLDSENGGEVMRMLLKLHDGGTSILMVTHSPENAAYGERTIRMLDGRIISESASA